MSFPIVAFIYPLLLAVLCAGLGLLVEWLAGFSLPALLIPAVGFGAAVVISQITVLSATIAPATPAILVILCLLGLALRWTSVRARLRAAPRSRWWAPAAAVASYLTVALPLIAAGHLTFPGYLLDTTAGFHLAAAEYMLHHGAGLPAPYHAYGAMLSSYYGNGYPSGGQVLLGVTGWLSGQDLLWLYFPFQVFALAVSSLVLAFVAERAGLPRWAAAFAGWIASVPALVAAYAMMGSIKEITALPLLLVMGAVIVLARQHARAGLRAAIPFAVAAAGAIGAVGPSALAWIVLFTLAVLAYALPVLRSLAGRFPAEALRGAIGSSVAGIGAAGAALAVLVIVLAVPTVTRLSSALGTAQSLSGGNTAAANDPGNLLRPLRFVQAFGVWLGTSHRIDPKYLNETYALIGIGIICFALGVFWLIRRRAWPLLAWVGISLLVWGVLYERGTEWTDAKVMMLTSPVVVLVAMIGAFGELRTYRFQGVLLAAVLGGAVLASDALLYHGTNLAPSARYTELRSIGQRFADQGPTLLPDFDEYTFYVLRKLDVDSPGFALTMRRSFLLDGGATPAYARSYDVDDIEAPFVQQFRLIVIRRSALWSRPPGNFELAFSGAYYDVWRRVGPAPRLHIPVGSVTQPVGLMSCHRLRSLGQTAARDQGQLSYATRPLNVVANLATSAHSSSVIVIANTEGIPSAGFNGPGSVTTTVDVKQPGSYRLWLGGSVDRPLRVLVDGHEVSAPSTQSGDDASMIDAGTVGLTAGRHVIELIRGGGGVGPGDDAGSEIQGVFLQAVGPEQETVATVAPQAWRSLCGRPLDWVEIR